LENDIKESLDTLEIDENLSIAIIGLAKAKSDIENLIEKYKINFTTYYLNSPLGGGMDKVKAGKTLKKVFEGYKTDNFVPVAILCNDKFEILECPEGYTFNSILTLYNNAKKR
jgi:hypothetical protein